MGGLLQDLGGDALRHGRGRALIRFSTRVWLFVATPVFASVAVYAQSGSTVLCLAFVVRLEQRRDESLLFRALALATSRICGR